jgi:hypothetical protein
VLVWHWFFANVLMRVGKKAAGKKNKFWCGKCSFFIIQFFSCVFYFRYFYFDNRSNSIAYNGLGIAEGGEKVNFSSILDQA